MTVRTLTYFTRIFKRRAHRSHSVTEQTYQDLADTIFDNKSVQAVHAADASIHIEPAWAQLTMTAATGGQAITTAYETVTEWDVAEDDAALLTADVDGTITVGAGGGGVYEMSFEGRFAGASAHTTSFQAANDAVEEGPTASATEAGTDERDIALHYFIALAATDVFTLNAICGAAETITFQRATLTLKRIAL
jgi:hypothetical protein